MRSNGDPPKTPDGFPNASKLGEASGVANDAIAVAYSASTGLSYYITRSFKFGRAFTFFKNFLPWLGVIIGFFMTWVDLITTLDDENAKPYEKALRVFAAALSIAMLIFGIACTVPFSVLAIVLVGIITTAVDTAINVFFCAVSLVNYLIYDGRTLRQTAEELNLQFQSLILITPENLQILKQYRALTSEEKMKRKYDYGEAQQILITLDEKLTDNKNQQKELRQDLFDKTARVLVCGLTLAGLILLSNPIGGLLFLICGSVGLGILLTKFILDKTFFKPVLHHETIETLEKNSLSTTAVIGREMRLDSALSLIDLDHLMDEPDSQPLLSHQPHSLQATPPMNRPT